MFILAKSFWRPLLFSSILKLIGDLLQFVQPQLLRLMITFIEQPGDDLKSGVTYALLMFVCAVIHTILTSAHIQRMFKIGMGIRSALVSAIYRFVSNMTNIYIIMSIIFILRLIENYRKLLILSSNSRMSATTGEVINLMSNDVQQLFDLMPFISFIWSAPLQTALAAHFLWQELGFAVLSGLILMIVLVALNAWLARIQKKMQVNLIVGRTIITIKQMKPASSHLKVRGQIRY